MKKIFLLFISLGLVTFTGCSSDDDHVHQDNDTISEVFQIIVDFQQNADGEFSVVYPLNPSIYDSDMVLVYRRFGSFEGSTIWELIPRTIYLNDGNEVDYDFNFTAQDILLYMGATFDLNTAPEFTQNQTFRVVIIPGYDTTARVDFSDYNKVAKMFNIRESDVKIMK